MKKILSLIICMIITLTACQFMVSCNEDPAEEPEYSSEYLFNETHHWRSEINGSSIIDKGEHINDSGKCQLCDYYWDCPNLMFTKTTIDGVLGYEVMGYDDYVNPQYLNVKVPEYYQSDEDDEPLPVISIGVHALSNRQNESNIYCSVAIKSVKLPDTLLRIKNYAFSFSDIKEIIIPDSVKGDLQYTFLCCSELKRVVIGNGVKRLLGYVFQDTINLEELIVGNSVTQIRPRNFINNDSIKYIVLPESLISIPERAHKGNAGYEAQSSLFMTSGTPDIFLNISEEYLQSITIERTPKDKVTSYLPMTSYGITRGWSGASEVFFKGEWHYDQNGKPVKDIPNGKILPDEVI